MSDADLLLPVTTATPTNTTTTSYVPSLQGVNDAAVTTDLATTSVVGASAQVEKVNDLTSIFTEISTAHSNFTAPSHSATKHTLKRPLEQQQATIPAIKTANYAVSFDDDEDDDEGDSDGNGEGDVLQKTQKLSSAHPPASHLTSSSATSGVKKASAAIIHRDIFASSDINTAPLTTGAGETESTHHRKVSKGSTKSSSSGGGGDKPPLSRKQQQDIDKRRAGNSTSSSSSPKLNRAARRALGKGE